VLVGSLAGFAVVSGIRHKRMEAAVLRRRCTFGRLTSCRSIDVWAAFAPVNCAAVLFAFLPTPCWRLARSC
jgi:hypothetical protein